jgi:hypothetical protein
MIVKRWNGSAFAEEYPKTKASLLFANDGTTTVFDTNQKIKMQFMPNEVIDNLLFVDSINSNMTLSEVFAQMYNTMNYDGYIGTRSFIGCYVVISGTRTISRQVTAHSFYDSGSTEHHVAFGVFSDTEEGNSPNSVVLESNDWMVITKISGNGTSGSPFSVFFSTINQTYEVATSSTHGIVKLGSDTSQSVAANAVSATASRTYAIQNNGSGQLVVNVPWVDTNTTYSKATATTLGLVELFDNAVQSVAANAVSSTASRTYGVQLDSSDRMVVNVPWVDTDTTYGLATTSVSGLVRLGVAAATQTLETASTTAGRFYRVGALTTGEMYVNVPWSDTNTTYNQMTSSTLGLGKLFSDTSQSVAANAVSSIASRTYGIQVNASGQLVVNVPWTDNDTTYSMMTKSTLGLGKLFSDTQQDVAANAVSSTASRTYGVQRNSSNELVVNVPWTDNNTTYTAGTNGGLTLDSTAFRMTYPLFVQTATPTTTVTGAIWFDIN